MSDNAGDNSKPVLLHVEDDDGSAYALSVALREQNADVDVLRLCDGEDGVLFLTRVGLFANAPRPTVIVLDLNLPKKNGHEVLADIRKTAELQHVRVFMLSSSPRPQDREKALSAGAKDYIIKPGDLDGFTAVANSNPRVYRSPLNSTCLPEIT